MDNLWDCVDNSAGVRITNNPSPTPWVKYTPDTYEPVISESYIKNNGNNQNVIIGSQFDELSSSTGSEGGVNYIIWNYGFSEDLPTGSYAFHAKAQEMSTRDILLYGLNIMVDVTPPTITEITLYEDNVLSQADTIEETKRGNITITSKDDDGITDTVVTKVEMLVVNSNGDTVISKRPMVSKGNNQYFLDLGILPIETYTATLYSEDNLTNQYTTTYTFYVGDSRPPSIDLVNPFGGVTNLEYPTLVFSTGEDSTCKLYRVRADNTLELKTQTTTPQIRHSLSGFPIDIGAGIISKFNITCKDEHENEGSDIINIKYSTELPIISSLTSKRGSIINAYSGGEITGLIAVTNVDTTCFYKGGKTPQDPPTGSPPEVAASMAFFGTGTGKTHTKDLTSAIENTPNGVINTNYKYYVLCKEEDTGLYTDLGEIEFNVDLQLRIINATPNGPIYDKEPKLNVNLTRQAFCRYKRNTSNSWIGLGEVRKFEYEVSLGHLDYGRYTYDFECALPSQPPPVGISEKINFTVLPQLSPPTLWDLPNYTRQSSIDIVGYTNQSNVDVTVGVFNLDTHTLLYSASTHTDYSSNLLGTYFSESQYSSNTIDVGSFAFGELSIGDYIEFSGHYGENFRRYRVSSKSSAIEALFGIRRIIFEGDFYGAIAPDETFYVYDSQYPDGWFALTVNLQENIKNDIGIISVFMGEESEMSSKSINYDTQSPTITLEYPPNNYITSNNKTTIKARINDNFEIDSSTLRIDVEGPCNIEDLTYPLNPGGLDFQENIVSFDITNTNYCDGSGEYKEGTYAVSLNVTDKAGNKGTTKWSFEIDRLATQGPDLEIEGNVLLHEDRWYTNEYRPIIKINFSDETILNEYILESQDTSGTNYILQSTETEPYRRFTLTPSNVIGEGTYQLKINARGTPDNSVETVFYFDIVVDRSGPTINTAVSTVPSSVDYNTESSIELSVSDIIGVDSVMAKVNGNYYPMAKVGELYHLSTNAFLPSSAPFAYLISFYTNDSLGNIFNLENYVEIEFTDSTSPTITILEPEYNYTNTAANTIKLQTDDPSSCNLSWDSNFPYWEIQEFSTANKYIHEYSFDFVADNIAPQWDQSNPRSFPYYIKCTNIFDLTTGPQPFRIWADTTPLKITRTSSAKLTYYTDNLENTISVETNKPAICRYSDTPVTKQYNLLDQDFGTEFSLVNSITRDFESKTEEHTLFIDCRDTAGNYAQNASWVNFTVNIQVEFAIEESGTLPSSLEGAVSDNTPILWIKTNKEADYCNFNGISSTRDESTPWVGRIYHMYYFDISNTLSEGSHTYGVNCWKGREKTAEITFLIDTEHPSAPTITSPSDDDIVGNTITITGTTDADAKKVFFYINDAYVGEAEVTSQSFSKTLNDLSTSFDDGGIEIKVNAEDIFQENGRSDSASITLTLDTISDAPVLGPLPQYTNKSTLTISGTAEPMSTINLYRFDDASQEGNPVATTVTANDGSFSAEDIVLNPDSNYIYSKSIDSRNNPISESSNEIFLIYDNQKPVFSAMSPSHGDTGVYGTGLTISVLVSDNYGIDESSIEMKVNNQIQTYVKTNEDNVVMISTTLDLGNGQNNISVSSKDMAGNINRFEWNFEVFVPVPCTPGVCDTAADKWCNAGTWTSTEYCAQCSTQDSTCPITTPSIPCDNNRCDTAADKWCNAGTWTSTEYCAQCSTQDSTCPITTPPIPCDNNVCDTQIDKWCNQGTWDTQGYCIRCGALDAECGTIPPNLIEFSINKRVMNSGDYINDTNILVGFKYDGESTLQDIQLDDSTLSNWQTTYSTTDNIEFTYNLGALSNTENPKFTVKASNEGFGHSTDSLSFIIDTTKPTIDISDSIDILVSSEENTISGTYVEDNLKNIKVHNQLLDSTEISSNTFSKTITLPVDTTTNVQATIEDKAGNTAKDYIEIEVKSGKPILTLIEIPDTTKEDLITLQGTTLPNTEVNITVNGREITLMSDDTGQFSQILTLINGLKLGDNEIIITVIDDAGRTNTITNNLYIDQEGPTLVKVPSNGERGNFNQIIITLDDHSEIEESSITFKLNDGDYPFTFNPSLNQVIVDISLLIDGVYTVQLTAQDILGNPILVTDQTWSFTKNRNAPTITLIYPLAGFVKETTPIIKFSVENYNSIEVPQLTYDGGSYPTVKIPSTSFEYQIAGILSEGTTYELTLRAEKDGNYAELKRDIQVDLNNPTILIIQSSLPSITNKTTIDVSGTFIEDNVLSIKVNNILVSDIDLDEGTFTARDVPLTTPQTILTAEIKDNSGRTGTSNSVTINIDRTPPESLIISSPSQNEVVGANIITITGQTEDGAELIIGGQNYGVLSDGTINVQHTLSQSGDNTLKITVKDQAGNARHAEIGVYYDNIAPDITEITPDESENAAPIGIRAKLDDRSDITSIEISINDSNDYYYSLSPSEIISSQTSLLHAYSPPDNGTYLINITAKDEFGNQHSTYQQFLFDTAIPSKPQFNLQGTITNNPSPQLIFTFTEQVNLDSLKIGSTDYPVPVDSNDIFTFDAVGLADKIHNIEISAYAPGGTESKGKYYFSFTKDSEKPKATISSSVPSYITDTTLTITGTCSDNIAVYDELTVTIKEGTMSTLTDCVLGIYSAAFTLSDNDGIKTVIVEVEDTAGNKNTTSKAILLDRGNPVVTIQTITNDNIVQIGTYYQTSLNKVKITGNIDDDNIYNLLAMINKNTVTYESYLDASGNFEINITLIITSNQETKNNITITAIDEGGLKGTQNIIIIHDQQGPEISNFEPETYTTAEEQPVINIVTNEKTLDCWIDYTTKTTGQLISKQFSKSDDTHFSIKLVPSIDFNDDHTPKTQNIIIYCKDQFSISKIHTKQFTVDQKIPTFDDFSVYYGRSNGILTLSDTLEAKEYALVIFEPGSAAAEVIFTAVTNEDTKCRYNGSYIGQFQGYDTYTKQHETGPISIVDGHDYMFNIECEDKAGLNTTLKIIKIQADSLYDPGQPTITPQYPPFAQTTTISSFSLIFKGLITPPPGYSIRESKLQINNEVISLPNAYEQQIQLPNDGEYTYHIWAVGTNDKVYNRTGYIIVDTTGPGGCVKVGDSIICQSQSLNQGGRSTTSTPNTEPDQDNDGLPDTFEYRYWDCITCANRDEDSDGDGKTNLEEYNLRTIPVSVTPGVDQGPGRTVTSSIKEGDDICIDSDDGMDYYVKGITAGPLAEAPDDPSNLAISISITDFCSGVDDILYEFGCNSEAPYYVYDESYTCPNGCQDGACLP